jgi:hypothetical protein
MTRVRITRNTVADHRAVMVGEVLDLDDREARLLVGLRKAEVIPPVPRPAPQPAAENGAAAEPGQAGEDPRPIPGPLSTTTAAALVKKSRRKKIIGIL